MGRGEDGQGLDEDVGSGFVSGQVGVELVSVGEAESALCSWIPSSTTSLPQRMHNPFR